MWYDTGEAKPTNSTNSGIFMRRRSPGVSHKPFLVFEIPATCTWRLLNGVNQQSVGPPAGAFTRTKKSMQFPDSLVRCFFRQVGDAAQVHRLNVNPIKWMCCSLPKSRLVPTPPTHKHTHNHTHFYSCGATSRTALIRPRTLRTSGALPATSSS